MGDLDLDELTVRALGDVVPDEALRRVTGPRVDGETPIAPLPQLLGTKVGGLAARGFDSDLRIEVFALAGGSYSGGVFGQPFAFNELYRLTLRPDEDGNYVADGDWQYLADFADALPAQPNSGVIPLTGLASLGDALYAIDSSSYFSEGTPGVRADGYSGGYAMRHVDIVGLEFSSSGGAGSLSTNLRIPYNEIAEDVFNLYTFNGMFAQPTALDGSNDRGTTFAALNNLNTYSDRVAADEGVDLGWAAQFFDHLPQFQQTYGFMEFDPRTQYIVQTIYFGDGSTASPDSGPSLFMDRGFDGLAYEDGKLVASGIGSYFDSNSESSGYGRFFLTIDPDTGEVESFEPEFEGSGGSTRPILGLAGSNYGTPPASRPLAPQEGGYDNLTIDPEFAKIAYSARAIGLDDTRASGIGIESATPFSALYTLHIVDTALDPDAAARAIELDQIPHVLHTHVDQTGGVGLATYDLRDPLPPGHPLAGSASDRGLDVRFVGLSTDGFDDERAASGGSGGSGMLFATLGNRDLRDYDINGLEDGSLPSYLYDSYVEGGHTTRYADGSVRDRLLVGGNTYGEDRDSGGGYYVEAYNEVFEFDASSESPSWTFLGKFLPEEIAERADSGGSFWNIGDSYNGYDWPALTGLSALGDQDYAISHDARIFQLQYPDLGGSGGSINGTLVEMADLRWDFGGALATAESRGSLFAVGQFGGTEASVPVRGGGGDFHALSNLVVYEVDPRNSFVKDAWWGFAGDFETGLATTWGTFDSWQGATPVQISSIQGAAFVEGGDAGTLVISGDFYFEPGENGGPKRSKGKKGKSRKASRGFYEQAFLSINIAAEGTSRSPYLMRIDSNEGYYYSESGWVGLASNLDSSGSAPASISLNPATGAKDFETLGYQFSRIAYTEDALRSGAIQQVFASEYARSVPGVDQAALLANPLLEQALAQFVGQEDGIAQATAYLQTALGEGAVALSQGAIEAGTPSTGLDPVNGNGKGKGKGKKSKSKKMSNGERRALMERLRQENQQASSSKGRRSGR